MDETTDPPPAEPATTEQLSAALADALARLAALEARDLPAEAAATVAVIDAQAAAQVRVIEAEAAATVEVMEAEAATEEAGEADDSDPTPAGTHRPEAEHWFFK